MTFLEKLLGILSQVRCLIISLVDKEPKGVVCDPPDRPERRYGVSGIVLRTLATRGRKRVPASEAQRGGWSEAEGPKDDTAYDMPEKFPGGRLA